MKNCSFFLIFRRREYSKNLYSRNIQKLNDGEITTKKKDMKLLKITSDKPSM